MDIVRTLLNCPWLKEPDDCNFCHKKFDRNATHMICNLIVQLEIDTDMELRKFSSYNCVNDDHGLPARAIDMLYYFIASFFQKN
jgi:hypothetical protein